MRRNSRLNRLSLDKGNPLNASVMNPSFHNLHRIEAVRTLAVPEQDGNDIFSLQLLYREGGSPQHYLGVNVAPDVLNAIQGDQVVGLHIVTLAMNGLASSLIPGQPTHIVMGVVLRDGRRLSSVPAAYRVVKWFGVTLCISGMLAGVGISLAADNVAWLGVALLLASSHVLRSVCNLPTKPFWGYGSTTSAPTLLLSSTV